MNNRKLIRGMLLCLACLLIYFGVNMQVSEKEGLQSVNNTEAVYEEGRTGMENKVYLTFDDGPSKNTEKILDVLKEYDAVATFFLVGDSVTEDYESVIQRMVQEGHAIGLHCSCHNYNKVYENSDSCVGSILNERDYLSENFGISSNLCRLPGGSSNTYIKNKEVIVETLHSEGLKIFDWNVSAEDSVGIPTKESIINNIFPCVADYSEPIVLMHDGVVNDLTVKTLPEILKKLEKYGYEYGTLEEREEFFYK